MVKITESPLDINEALNHVQAPDCGGTTVFIGTVRNENNGKKVSAIEYTAFKEMAEKELGKIVEEAMSQWKLGKVYVAHRVGKLVIGEPSVVVAVSSAHRAETFEACRFIIEALKKTVPIWKKEFCD